MSAARKPGGFGALTLAAAAAIITGLVAPHAQATCIGDLSGDHVVNGLDLGQLLGQWTGAQLYAPCPPYRPADLNSDCRINGLDLAMLLAAWGPCPLPIPCPSPQQVMAGKINQFIAQTGFPIQPVMIQPVGIISPASLPSVVNQIVQNSAIANLDEEHPAFFGTGTIPSDPTIDPERIEVYRQHLLAMLRPGDTVLNVQYIRTDGPGGFTVISVLRPDCELRWDSLFAFTPTHWPPQHGSDTRGCPDGGVAGQQYEVSATAGEQTWENNLGRDAAHFSVTATVDCSAAGVPLLCTGTCEGQSTWFGWEAQCTIESQTIVGNCCRVVANFGLATGFKSISIGADGFTISITGTLGMGSKWSSTALACCTCQ